MRLTRAAIGLFPFLLCAADGGLQQTLKAVEARYNSAKTLQVLFQERYTPPGLPRRTESGKLALSKPGRMRWDYTDPAGKLFVSDGKNLWLYVPEDNRAEKMKLKESEDMRAPLAFLLGKLNFAKEFRNLEATPDPAGGLRVTAEPKTDSLPYSKVEFSVLPDHRIRQVKVTGFDKSILEFTFDAEQVNPRLDAKLFRFEVPPGVQLVEAAN
ncbi:MAG: outer membrane lipoprotein carrier protein LolA [Planctomycetes bacterium]|nr:outer membrane lipoprotein carrier protein LolA [Planctomycetota bacterium]